MPVNSKLLGFIGLVTESAKVSDLSATPPSARRRNNAGGRLNAQTQPHFCTSSRTTQSSAVSRNDPPFKTLGLKLQNNTMTHLQARDLVIQTAHICLQHAHSLRHLKTSQAFCWSFLSLATSIFAPLRHLTPICRALLQSYLQICRNSLFPKASPNVTHRNK